MPKSPASANAIRLRDIPDAILLGAALFLFTRNLLGLAILAYRLQRTFDFHNITEEFTLWRFLIISLLPFGFNLAFGLYFGHKFNQFLSRASGAFFGVLANPALWGILLWWTIFNLPHLAAARWTAPLPMPDWPAPDTLYEPLRVELLLFHSLGNRALLAGFFFRVGIERLWPLPPEEFRKILPRQSPENIPPVGKP